MDSEAISPEEFLQSTKEFYELSKKCFDTWKIIEDTKDIHKTYLKKEQYLSYNLVSQKACKAEYIIFYNLSYGVPSFSFNIWSSDGQLLNLEDIRKMSAMKIKKEDFYSVITQQEHPILSRPYFIIHPCHTASLLADFKNISKNIIVTFLGLITPLIELELPLEYG